MAEIRLARGEVALVDDADYPALSQHRWYSNGGYAVRTTTSAERSAGMPRATQMHRQVLGLGAARPDQVPDHINGKRLDNRRQNLRTCTHAQNLVNRGPQTNNLTGLKGVSRMPSGKYRVVIRHDDVTHDIGLFEGREEAAIAYNIAALEHYGQYAWLNRV